MCKKLVFVFALVALLSSLVCATEPNLVAWYKCEDTNLITGAQITDSSGNGNHGVIVSLATHAGSGYLTSIAGAPSAVDSGTLAFDSGAVSTGAINMKHASDPGITNSTYMSTTNAEMSIALWEDCYGPDEGGMKTIWGLYDGSGAMGFLSFSWAGGGMLWLAGIGWGDQLWPSPTADMIGGGWNHWVVTKNANTGLLKAYHNGVFRAQSLPICTTSFGKPAIVLELSSMGFHFWNMYWNGKMDDFRQYNAEIPEDAVARLAGIRDAKKAYWPKPNNGSTESPIAAGKVLTWVAGTGAVTHNVLLGTSPSALAPLATGISATTATISTGLALNKTYYWRVDEVGTSTVTGDVWTFTTTSHITVEDFESYADTSALRATWVESEPGWNYGNLETTIKLNGAKSMRLEIQNQYDYVYNHDSEKTFSSNQDWTTNNVKALGVWFRGDATNVAQPVYVKLTDAANHSGKKYYPNNAAFQSSTWTQFNVNLNDAAFSSVSKTTIKKIAVGAGDGVNPSAQDKVGDDRDYMYVDDIQLFPSRCIASAGPACDVTGDCTVNAKDLKIMSDQWLGCSTPFTAGCVPMNVTPAGIVTSSPFGGLITPVPVGGVTVDGILTEWNPSTTTWYTIAKPYSGYNRDNIGDIDDIKYAVKWDPADPTVLYVATKVRDLAHNFKASETAAPVWDGLEVRLEANGTLADLPLTLIGEWTTQRIAQFYNNWRKPDGSTGMSFGTNDLVTAGNGFGMTNATGFDPVDPCIITYEIKLRTFSNYGGLGGAGTTTFRNMAPGVVVGMDFQVDTISVPPAIWGAVFTWPGWNPTNPKAWLPMEVVNQPTACGDWGYASTDFNHDCKVNFTDYATLADSWLVVQLWP